MIPTAALWLTGCVAANAPVGLTTRVVLSRVAVHPLEATPVEVPTELLLGTETIGAFRDLGVLGFVVGGVLVAVEGKSRADEAALWAEHAALLESGEVWKPSEVVARQVVTHLRRRSIDDVALLLPMTRLYQDRANVGLDLNGPVRSWYNGAAATERTSTSDADLVIEAGV